MAYPPTIRAEVKVTTGRILQVGRRELSALGSSDPVSCGLLAALFWPGEPPYGGRWIVVDTAQAFGRRGGRAMSAPCSSLVQAARGQPWLDDLRQNIDRWWPPMLQAFLEDALGPRAALVERLRRCHDEGTLGDQMPGHSILEIDHRRALDQIFGTLGESGAGRVLQDLFAYLLGLLGYRTITSNAVGVPDFVANDLDGSALQEPSITVVMTRDEASRLVRACEAGGAPDLATKIAEAIESADASPRPHFEDRGPSTRPLESPSSIANAKANEPG
jgi:hypothetical protein